jgi:hypothetical protein
MRLCKTGGFKSSSLLSHGLGKWFGVLTMFRPDLRTILHARTMTAFRICRDSLGYTDRFSSKRLGWHLWAPGSSTLSSFVCFAACVFRRRGDEWDEVFLIAGPARSALALTLFMFMRFRIQWFFLEEQRVVPHAM